MQTETIVQFPESGSDGSPSNWKSKYCRCCRITEKFLESRTKHLLLLTLIILDVAVIMTEICLLLVACSQDFDFQKKAHDISIIMLKIALAFSCLFMAELALHLWVEGFRYFKSWFHCLDAFVIVISLFVDIVDISTRWAGGDVAALVVLLRLWRFVKVADELSIEAMEQMKQTRQRVEELEAENDGLKTELERYRPPQDEEAGPS